VPQEKGEIAVIIGESDPKHRTAFVPSARSRYAVADLQRVFVFFWVGGGGGGAVGASNCLDCVGYFFF
jgi:hypothetical protein